MTFGYPWLSEVEPPPDLFLVMLIFAFNLFYLLETQEIFMKIARAKWSVHDISRIQILPSWFSTYTRFQLLLPSSLYYFYYLEPLEPCLIAWWLWSVDFFRYVCSADYRIINLPQYP